MEENNNSTDNSSRQGKIERLVEKYDITDTTSEIQRRRRGQDGDVSSLRDLAEFFNRKLLERRMLDTDTAVLSGEADNLYRLLTDDGVSSGNRTRARGRLERLGIDVDQLEREFVSREAIRTFLQRQGVTRPDSETDPVERESKRIRQLRTHAATVTEDKLAHLRKTDRISLGEFRVLVEFQVFCEECNTQFEVNELLDRQGCNCMTS